MKFFAILFFALTPFLVRADGDEVVVIYNTRVPESEDVARYYAKARHVPENQIYGFSLTANEEMSRDEFRDSFQQPLARDLEFDGLWQLGSFTNAATNGQPGRIFRKVISSKIRYAVLCYGIPLKIAPDPGLQEPIAPEVRPEFRRNEAAVDSELSLLPMLEMNLPLSGPLPNWVYGATNAARMNPTNGLLMVARLDGPTAAIARGLVDKAMQAERDGLWGRGYFDTRGLTKADTNYFLGDEWILGAAEVCRQLGFETTVDKNPETFHADFPMSQIAIYCGWYDQNISGPFTLPEVEFMPGAFAYHLHSFSAMTMRSTNLSWCAPLLAKGATCTMGCVYEPYLSGTPNVAAFLARWIGDAFTFGEAAYAAQPVTSWQTTVIGDPLYRPFGKSPPQLHAELARRDSPLIEWSHLRVVDLAIAHGARLAQAQGYLEDIGTTTNSAVLTEKLADLCELEGKPDSAIYNYQKALKLNPSPEQRIQIRLTLGEKLLTANRNADAIDNYKKLLEESPDYPGRNSIEDKLKNLVQPATTNAPAKP